MHQISVMRLLTILSFLLFSATLSAQKTATAVKKDTVKALVDTSTAPIIKITNTVVSYGSIVQGSDPIRIVTFTNVGKTPLIISHCESTCTCLVAFSSTEPIPPGGSGQIQLKYNTDLVGTFNKTVTIYSNSKKNVILSVKGIVRPAPVKKKSTQK